MVTLTLENSEGYTMVYTAERSTVVHGPSGFYVHLPPIGMTPSQEERELDLRNLIGASKPEKK